MNNFPLKFISEDDESKLKFQIEFQISQRRDGVTERTNEFTLTDHLKHLLINTNFSLFI